ncbi:unnamed protein product [Prunus armeniaca]|uniref:Uncharacterized protein n=1 Tax=Prunus armeniaca TaxID=36596 RepID=A0A6J5VY15_PRUAR|nr:unnamed protein product [Prunus armeniaca]
MLPQQKNPAGVSQSMHQQTTSNNNLEEPDKRPFSIRQYVLACRQKDVFSNWPFPEKYLQMCLNYGISDVLPPLESHNSAIQSLRGAVGLNCTQQDDENVDYSEDKEPDTIEQEIEDECKLYSDSEEAVSALSIQHCHLSPSNSSHKHEENKTGFSPHDASNIMVSTDQPSTPSTTIPSSHLNVIQCNKTLPSSTKPRRMKKQHKGKHKKRSMASILSVAKPCTSEDLLRIKRLCCVSSAPLEQGGEGIENMIDVRHDCNSDLTKDFSSEKLERDDSEEAKLSMLSGQKIVVKFKFSGCKSDV